MKEPLKSGNGMNKLDETWLEGDNDRDYMCTGGMGVWTEGGARRGRAQAGEAALQEWMGALP